MNKGIRVITGLAVFLCVIGIIAGSLFVIGMVYEPSDVDKLSAEVLQTENLMRQMEQDIEQMKLEAQAKREAIAKLSGDDQASSETRRVSVEVEVVKTSLFVDAMLLPAEVEASEDIALGARSSGPVEWIGPKEGDRVEQGELIMRIDAEQQTQALKSAKAAAELARLNFERTQNLRKQGVSTQEALDQSRSVLQQTEAALSIAEQNLKDAHLTSPISGVVDTLPFDLGEFVNRGQEVARIVSIASVKVVVNVPEKDVTYLEEGQPVKVLLPVASNGMVEGRIQRIRLLADNMSRTYRLEALIPNEKRIFRPGMITKMELVRRQNPEAIVVSMFSLLQTQDGPIVYVEEDGIAQMRMVKTGARRGMEVEILEGLEAGDHLIVAGQRTLTQGAALKVVEQEVESEFAVTTQQEAGPQL